MSLICLPITVVIDFCVGFFTLSCVAGRSPSDGNSSWRHSLPAEAEKLEYIHNNAVVAGLVSYAEEYKYSSAKFYSSGIDEFNMLTHYSGN